MAIVRFLAAEQHDGAILGNGVYRMWMTLDQRPSGAEFILSIEIDGTERPQPTNYIVSVQGAGHFQGVVPPNSSVRVPETGDFNGLRIDGGREYAVSLW